MVTYVKRMEVPRLYKRQIGHPQKVPLHLCSSERVGTRVGEISRNLAKQQVDGAVITIGDTQEFEAAPKERAM